MPRVSKETLDKLQAFIDSLPVEARNKCALCNEALTHMVKTAEVETGAGTATVTRELASRINETAAPGDRVSDGALRQRVLSAEGAICRNPTNNHQPETAAPGDRVSDRQLEGRIYRQENFIPMKHGDNYQLEPTAPDGPRLKNGGEYYVSDLPMRYAKMAVAQLESISQGHPGRNEALDYVNNWIKQNR